MTYFLCTTLAMLSNMASDTSSAISARNAMMPMALPNRHASALPLKTQTEPTQPRSLMQPKTTTANSCTAHTMPHQLHAVTDTQSCSQYHHCRRCVAGDGQRVSAPLSPRSTARLQRTPMGPVESFRSWSSHLFPGRCHVRSGGRLRDALTRSQRAIFACVSSSSQATCQNTEVSRRDGYGTVKSDRSALVLHHFGLGRTIGFQAAVPVTSAGKHLESFRQLLLRARGGGRIHRKCPKIYPTCLRIILRQKLRCLKMI